MVYHLANVVVQVEPEQIVQVTHSGGPGGSGRGARCRRYG